MSNSALFRPHKLNNSQYLIPSFLYGTAWKKERTADLVYEALKAGFKGIDTAAQPRHYNEKLVGDGIRRAIGEGLVTRKNLFIQTKYTPVTGQDPGNMPYDPSLPIPDQIHASIASSLKNLSTGDYSYLDSVVLHSPIENYTLLALQTLNTYVDAGKIRHIGIANIQLSELDKLVRSSAIIPAVVQNRFIGRTGYDSDLRKFCKEYGITYQSFWTLTGNPELLQYPESRLIADKVDVSREVALYALVLGLQGITILNGTTSNVHMKDDLAGIAKVERWAEGSGKEDWTNLLEGFRRLVGEM